MTDDDRDPDDATDVLDTDPDTRWVLLATADTPLDEVQRRVDVLTQRGLDECRDAIELDDDLSNEERSAILAYLARVTPALVQRVRCDVTRAHARLRH